MDFASLVSLAVLLALPLVVRFGRSAAQILQNGPRQLGQVGCAPCSPSGGPFWPLSSPNPSKRTSPAWSAWLFWPLNAPKRTSPAWSGWLCSLLSLWWPVLAAQQPKSFKTDLASLVCLAVRLALLLVVRFVRWAAQILQNGPRQLGLLGCAPCSLPGGPFWPLRSPNPPKRTSPTWSAWCAPCSPSGGPFWTLSSPNPPKRTSPALSAWLCSLLSLWWSVLPAQQPKSFKTDLASSVRLAVLLALPLVVLFGRSAAQILQNGPRQLGQLGCAPCSPSGGPFCPPSSPNPSKRTSPARSAWLCSLLSLWWSFLAAQQPKSFKTDPQLFHWLQVQGRVELTIFRLRALSSADWARHPCHIGHDLQILAEKRCIQTGSHRKPQADSQEEREQTQVQPLCPERSVKKSEVSVPVSPWCSVLSAERPKSSKTDLASLVCLAVLAAKCSKADLASLVRLAVLLALPLVSVLDAQQPKSSKTDSWGEHSQADQAGEVCFGGFGLLSGQNGPPGRERDRDPPPALVWWGCRACVRTGTWMLSSHPTPPHPTPPHPTPPHPPPHHPTPPTLKPDGVADEGKMVSQMRENQGVLVSQMRGIWCHRWGAYRMYVCMYVCIYIYDKTTIYRIDAQIT